MSNPTTKPQFETVELIPAFVWTCPDCGTDSYCRTVVIELSDDEMAELRREHGIDVYEEGQFLTSPKKVKCSNCNKRFAAVDFGEPQEDEDDDE